MHLLEPIIRGLAQCDGQGHPIPNRRAVRAFCTNLNSRDNKLPMLSSKQSSTTLFDERDLMRRQIDNAVLEMALVGYNAKRDEIVEKMADIERQLGVLRKGASPPRVAAQAPTAAKPKRTMSAAGKRAIRAGVKKRWAAFHAKAAVKPAKQSAKKPKRTMSPAVKARLAANLAKARTAKAHKRAAQGA